VTIGEPVTRSHLPTAFRAAFEAIHETRSRPLSLSRARRRAEALAAIAEVQGNKSAAARKLGIGRRALYKILGA